MQFSDSFEWERSEDGMWDVAVVLRVERKFVFLCNR
jgi:hypothetical protein